MKTISTVFAIEEKDEEAEQSSSEIISKHSKINISDLSFSDFSNLKNKKKKSDSVSLDRKQAKIKYNKNWSLTKQHKFKNPRYQAPKKSSRKANMSSFINKGPNSSSIFFNNSRVNKKLLKSITLKRNKNILNKSNKSLNKKRKIKSKRKPLKDLFIALKNQGSCKRLQL